MKEKCRKSRWGGLRQGSGRPKSKEKSRFTHQTRIDPKWDERIKGYKGRNFSEKLDAALEELFKTKI